MSVRIEEVISSIQDKWMKMEGVEGIGQGKIDDKDCIMVFVSRSAQEMKQKIPEKLEGFVVRVEETGIIQPQNLRKKK
ncbi:hypothetical protein IBX65_08415 [Candidatus Aerophobetes bacterium]|nr:hypothetical protein [Candidatus Aerophobetes bacterium]